MARWRGGGFQGAGGDDGLDARVERLLVLGGRGARQLAERRAGENPVLVADLQGAIEEVAQGDAGAAHGDVCAGGLDAISGSLRAEGLNHPGFIAI